MELKVFLQELGIFLAGSKDDMIMDWAGTTFDRKHIFHEVTHLVDRSFKTPIPITYSISLYGLTNQDECLAENVAYYLLNKEYFKQVLPVIADYIEGNIPNLLIQLSNELT